MNKLMCAQQTIKTSENGFVLFEALLALALLSFGMIALIQVCQKSVHVLQFRQHYYRPALEIAENLLSKIELKPSASLMSENKLIKFDQKIFNCQVQTSEWSAVPGLNKVSVTVDWTDRGKHGSLTLATLLSADQTNSVAKER
ncbi:MAG: hypothetical protein ACE5HS_12530 [bacterium]